MPDIYAHCRNVTHPAAALPCLKRAKLRLHSRCKAAVTARQMESSQHAQLDAPLAAACAQEMAGLCGDAGWAPGAMASCLLSHMWRSNQGQGKLEGACRQEVFR
jgi:hypothetical protein